MNESELRETLAPKITAKLVARAGLGAHEAEQLAHEIIATVQGAMLAMLASQSCAARLGVNDL